MNPFNIMELRALTIFEDACYNCIKNWELFPSTLDDLSIVILSPSSIQHLRLSRPLLSPSQTLLLLVTLVNLSIHLLEVLFITMTFTLLTVTFLDQLYSSFTCILLLSCNFSCYPQMNYTLLYSFCLNCIKFLLYTPQ